MSGFLEATALNLTRAIGRALTSEEIARRRGLLQALDPRVRLLGVLALVIAVTLSRKPMVVATLLTLAIVLALLSRVSLATLAKRVWLVVFLFTATIALPALFVTPGRAVWRAPVGAAQITGAGLYTAALLVLRVETAVTFTTLLVLCTPWSHVLKALRSLGLPQELIAMLAMTHRYVFLLTETAGQMLESRRSRTVGALRGALQRQMVTRSAGVLMSKSFTLSEEVYQAMLSRGFAGDVRLLPDFQMRRGDYAALAGVIAVGVAAAWWGR